MWGAEFIKRVGAGNQVRTGDLNLGKVALYQLSYSRTDLSIVGLLDATVKAPSKQFTYQVLPAGLAQTLPACNPPLTR